MVWFIVNVSINWDQQFNSNTNCMTELALCMESNRMHRIEELINLSSTTFLKYSKHPISIYGQVHKVFLYTLNL